MSSNISAFRICNNKYLLRGIQALLENELSLATFTEDARRKAGLILSNIEEKDAIALLSDTKDLDYDGVEHVDNNTSAIKSLYPPVCIFNKCCDTTPVIKKWSTMLG